MKKTLIATSLILLMFSTHAFSLGGGGMSLHDGLFWGSDLNRNEQLDIKEAKNIYNLGNKKVFAKYDKSDDGVITKLEFYDYLNQRSSSE